MPSTTDDDAGALAGSRPPWLRHLSSEQHVTVDAESVERARGIVGDETNLLEQARKLYAHVVGFMDYDATKQSWVGSSEHALTCQIGNCNDIHALYISLARSLDIPARMVMGFALEQQSGPEDCEVCGYHCWAEIFVPKLGWLPVDASCACKYGHENLFGNLELNHVAFSRGRDILLQPAQRGERLLYLFQAYAEVDGKPHAVERKLSFRVET